MKVRSQVLEEKEVPENDEKIFYGSVFHDFKEGWEGERKAEEEKESDKAEEAPVDYTKLAIEERAKLLPPPTEDIMEELKAYQSRMGYDADKMKSVRYKMEIYDDFVEEYDYRKKYCRGQHEREGYVSSHFSRGKCR